jgi:uroporphyrin-III C-methyltransferase/precorrin-2 dehydrogenase/sirohydrochlorin ferrochelatase
MRSFPAFVPLEGARVVVVGAGDAADAKARLFAGAPAELARSVAGTEPGLFDGAALAFIAVSEPEVRLGAWRAAKAAGARVNVVDHPALSDFFTPAIIDRGALVIGVGTSGAAPVLARDIRAKIEAVIPPAFERLAAFAAHIRAMVSARRPKFEGRRRAWEQILRGPAAARALEGDDAGALREAERVLRGDARARGVVHLVGAGPGDPELLTLKALRLLQDADVIFHDRLVDARVLDLARRDARRVFVGKARGDHSVPQREIEAQMIASARDGLRVIRLKGGDPFVFGRGGEELEALHRAGVTAFVVPGVTAALGCAAEAGAPLTHRDHAHAVTFVTGHLKDGRAPDLDWPALASAKHTIVVYMGVDAAPVIARELMAAGRRPETPALIVENGTTPQAKHVRGALADLGAMMLAHEIFGPAVLIIGDVAALGAREAQAIEAVLEAAP